MTDPNRSLDHTRLLVNKSLDALRRAAELQKANNELETSLSAEKEQSFSLASHYQQEVDQRNREIRDLERRLIRLKKECERTVESTRIDFEEALNRLKETHQTKETSLRRQVRSLKQKLTELQCYRDMKETADTKIDELEHTIEGLDRRYNEECQERERQDVN